MHFNMRSSKSLLKFLLLMIVTIAAISYPFVYPTTQNWQTLGATVSAQVPAPTRVEAVEAIGMTVSDMDRAVKFYSQVLSFQKISDVEVFGKEYEAFQGLFGLRMRVVKMQLGKETLILTKYLTPPGDPIPLDSRSNDLWFQHIAIVVSDMDLAYKHLREHDIQHVSTAPQLLPESLEAAAGIEAFYFRDLDGHNLELIQFPPDKGDPRWQKSTRELFLGIDHTAIAVSNTNTSLNFYQNLLGLKLAGKSENYGTEQEHLNNVFGVRLQISSLRAARGMGIEFLDYLAPPGGRPYPLDADANDLLHWETTLVVADADAAAQQLQLNSVKFISWGALSLPDRALGFRKGFLVRDPDGHVLRIVER